MAKKRILSILLCLLMAVPLIAVPVFATNGSTGDAVYTVIPWQTVGYGTSYRIQTEFIGSSSRVNSSSFTNQSTAGFSQTLWSYPSYNEVQIAGDGRPWSFQFVARNFVLDIDALEEINFSFVGADTGDDMGYNAEWRIQFSDVQLRNNVYNAYNYVATGSSRENPYGSVVPALKESLGLYTSNRYVYVDYILLTVTNTGDENPLYLYTEQNTVSGIPYARTWLSQYNMTHEKVITVAPANPNEVSFVDWLVVGVGGFLNFELWEGFTLNQLIEFVVVIGIVLWFITLLI